MISIKELGNTLIAGISGSGKSVFLRQLLKNAVSEDTPENIGFIIHDMTNINFRFLKGDPHMLMDMGRTEEDFEKQLEFLKEEIDRRTSGGSTQKSIYVIVDEFANIEDEEAINRLEPLMVNGPRVGVFFLLSSQRPVLFTEKMRSAANSKVAFCLFEDDGKLFCGNGDLEKRLPHPGDCLIITGIGSTEEERFTHTPFQR